MTRHYNFAAWLEVCDDMISEYNRTCRISDKTLSALQKELNKFFTDAKCQKVLFTDNDSIFFGMCVHPELSPHFISSVISDYDDQAIRVDAYKIEIDSKLFSSVLDIEPDELLAMMLHEIGHLVNDASVTENMKEAVLTYAAKNHITVELPDGEKERSLAVSILRYALDDTAHKLTSMFCIYKDGEVLADHFAYEYGMLEPLQRVLKKISRKGLLINNKVDNKLIVLTWGLRLIMDITFKRNTAVHNLMDAYRVTTSKISKLFIKDALTKLKSYSNEASTTVVNVYESVMALGLDAILEQEIIEESKESKERKERKRTEAILKGVDKFEEDYYTYVMEARSLGDKSDALYILREVNRHISVLEDVLESVELTDSLRKKYFDLLEKFTDLRYDLAHNAKFKYDYTNSVISISYPSIS